jgi:hypothetical protein
MAEQVPLLANMAVLSLMVSLVELQLLRVTQPGARVVLADLVVVVLLAVEQVAVEVDIPAVEEAAEVATGVPVEVEGHILMLLQLRQRQLQHLEQVMDTYQSLT